MARISIADEFLDKQKKKSKPQGLVPFREGPAPQESERPKGLVPLRDEPKPQAEVPTTPAPTAQPALIAKAKQATKKDAKKASKAIDTLQEGLTGEKPTKETKLSDEMKTALIGGLPLLIGGLLGGEEGLAVGAQAGLSGVKELQRGEAAKAEAEQEEAELQAKKDIEAEKIAVQREAIASKERIDRVGKATKLLGLKQQSAQEIQKRTVPGVGVALSDSDAEKLKEKKIVIDNVTDGIDRLTAIGDRSLASLSPEQRTAAQTEVQALIGQLRIPLTGPGPLTDSEREFMEEIIGNPTKIFSMSSNEMVKLDTIKNKFITDFENERKVRTVEGLSQSKIQEELQRRGLR